jgi:hypothetical protein
LEREYDELTASLDELGAGRAWFDHGSGLFSERMMALEERREGMAAKLQEIGTQAALVATHDCDQHTSLSAVFLCRDILDCLSKLKLGII